MSLSKYKNKYCKIIFDDGSVSTRSGKFKGFDENFIYIKADDNTKTDMAIARNRIIRIEVIN